MTAYKPTAGLEYEAFVKRFLWSSCLSCLDYLPANVRCGINWNRICTFAMHLMENYGSDTHLLPVWGSSSTLQRSDYLFRYVTTIFGNLVDGCDTRLVLWKKLDRLNSYLKWTVRILTSSLAQSISWIKFDTSQHSSWKAWPGKKSKRKRQSVYYISLSATISEEHAMQQIKLATEQYLSSMDIGIELKSSFEEGARSWSHQAPFHDWRNSAAVKFLKYVIYLHRSLINASVVLTPKTPDWCPIGIFANPCISMQNQSPKQK